MQLHTPTPSRSPLTFDIYPHLRYNKYMTTPILTAECTCGDMLVASPQGLIDMMQGHTARGRHRTHTAKINDRFAGRSDLPVHPRLLPPAPPAS